MNVLPSLIGIGWPVTVTPRWNNQLQKTVTGRVVAATYQQYPLYRFKVQYNYLSAADYNILLGFFNTQGGNLTPFWFDAGPGNDSVTAQVIGTGDGTTKTFQLLRSYGGYVEPVAASFAGAGLLTADGSWTADTSITVDATSPSAYVNGTAVAATFNSPTAGQVTLAAAPAAGAVVSWTGNYYFQVRFSQGSQDIDEFMAQLYSTKQIELETYW